MEGLKSQADQGETPGENQKRQENFDVKMGVLGALRDELKNACADGLLTYAGDVSLKLKVGATGTLWSRIETEAMLIAEEVISRQIMKHHNQPWELKQSVHTASSYRKALGFPTLGEDRHGTAIEEALITEARVAWHTALTVSRVLSWSGLDQYHAALPDFLPPGKMTEKEMQSEIQSRNKLLQEIKAIAEQPDHYRMSASDSATVFALDPAELYQMGDNYLIRGKHPHATIRLEVACVKAITDKLDSLRTQGNWVPPLNWQQVKVEQTAAGTLWRVGDCFWHESDEAVFYPGMQVLLQHIDAISERQRFAILDLATKKDAALLSQLDARYLPQDTGKVAEFLSKMADGRTGIDYVIRHADGFKKYLPDFALNPLAESMLRLSKEELAALPSWMFDRMNAEQTDRLISVMTPVWFPGGPGQADVMKLITLPEAVQNRVADQIVSCLQKSGGHFHDLSFDSVLNISPQILQRTDMASLLTGYFRHYAVTGADIGAASLLRLSECPEGILSILLRDMPPHRIFATEAGDSLLTALLQRKLPVHQKVDAYLEAHPHYLSRIGLEGIVTLPQRLKDVISAQVAAYITGNLAAVRGSLLSALQQDKEKESAFTLEMIKALPVNVWQEVLREIPPDRLFAPDHKINDISWSDHIRRFFDSVPEKGAFEGYLQRYLDGHPDYLRQLGLDGIAELPQSLRDMITPQITVYIKGNIAAVSASLRATIENEPHRPDWHNLRQADDSPTLRKVKILTADTWLAVLQEIPPDKFFPLDKLDVMGSRYQGLWHLQMALQDIEEKFVDQIERYVNAYLALHPDYRNQLGQAGISKAPRLFRDALANE